MMQRNGRYILTWAAALAALALLSTNIVLAKGPPAKILISGPGIHGGAEVTNPALLNGIALGILEDFSRAIDRPATVDLPSTSQYTLTRFFQDTDGAYMLFDRLHYYLPSPKSPAIIFYDGLSVGGGWSEYDGRWFFAHSEGEAAMHRLLDSLGAFAAPQQPLPATGGGSIPLQWVVLLACGAILGGGMFILRQRTLKRP